MALAAFNVFDYDGIRAVADAAAEENTQVYLQLSASTVKYYGAEQLQSMINLAAGINRSYLIVHLDHCDDLTLIESCIKSGWDSIMGDFSHLSIDENIKKMNEIKSLIGNRRVLVEGELGQVTGVEDGHGSDMGSFVNLNEVKKFVEQTEIDLLAVGIGNAHGFYESTDGIRIDLLSQVYELVPNQDLVLHGGTGIEDIKIQQMKQLGIKKINVSTEFKEIYMKSEHMHMESENRYNMVSLVQNRYVQLKEFCRAKIVQFR